MELTCTEVVVLSMILSEKITGIRAELAELQDINPASPETALLFYGLGGFLEVAEHIEDKLGEVAAEMGDDTVFACQWS